MKRSPQLENGYICYAHELDAALACADFTKGARIVLREVFAQIFGPALLKTAKVFPTPLADAYGTDKTIVSRSVKELVDAGVLVKVGECEYRFVKDYGQWTRNGKPRLTEDEMDAAIKATERAKSYKQSSVDNPVNKNKSEQQSSVDNPVNKNKSEQQSSVGNSVNVPVGNSVNALAIQSTSPLAIQSTVDNSVNVPVGNSVNAAHYIEPARNEPRGGIELGCAGIARAGAREDDCPEMPPEDGPVFIMPNRHKMTRGDAQDIWRRLWRGWKDKVLCAQFFSHQQWYPAETWRLAISEIATGRSRPRSIAYFEQRCADIQRRLEEGAAPEAAAGSNGHFALTSAPAPPARRLSKHDAAIAKAKELRAAGHNPLARFHEPEED